MNQQISLANTCSKLNLGDALPQQTTEVIGSSFQNARQTKYGFRGRLSKQSRFQHFELLVQFLYYSGWTVVEYVVPV